MSIHPLPLPPDAEYPRQLIEEARVHLGLNRRQFALTAGITPQALNAALKGHRGLTLTTAIRWAKAAGAKDKFFVKNQKKMLVYLKR